MEFTPVRLEDYDRIYPYTSVYGEGSCQHSPVSMYSLAEKYGDSVCVRDGALYTLRARLCDETFRVYLGPLGGGADFAPILEDARAHGKRVKFVTLTESAAAALEKAYPGRFEFTEDRDLAEYVYRSEVMASFSGSELRKRRAEVHTFRHMYGDRAKVTEITPADFRDVLAFERKWLADNLETHDRAVLERDERMIETQIAHFDELRLRGVILRIDGVTAGFCYGTLLNPDFYDVIVEKADRAVPHSFKVLRQESARRCAEHGCAFVNMEEDVGLPGLRALKMAYKPERLIRKLIGTEREER